MRFRAVVALCALTLLSACGSKPVIKGKVVDNFGQPVADASVKIANSTFAATTGADGSYELSYAPGSFTVTASKDGYAIASAAISVATPVEYPMGDLSVTKIPPQGGVYLQGDHDWLPLEKLGVSVSNQSSFFVSHAGWGTPPQANAAIVVADTTPASLRLVHIRGEDMIGQPYVPNGVLLLDDNESRENGFLKRTATLASSPDKKYCFVEFSTMPDRASAPIPGDGHWAYCFLGP